MKLSKSEFKSMIKECIRELVNEGAFNEVLKENIFANLQQTEEPTNKKRVPAKDLIQKDPVKQAQMQALARRMAGYDQFDGMSETITNTPAAPMNDNLKRLVETTAAQISKGDQNAANAYAAIFADTAMNTLPQQLANDPGSTGGFGSLAAATMQGAQEKVTEGEIKSLAPSGDTSRWAKLAFGK